ncbi:Cup2p KNAG_0E03480 [Huiozyma naganishii CBS 8797]|uniref:Copper-fist domain-containing protein n=1 Tax=Huiozyma naganishii (strain ATCC MYA-139 / BCRC 22969 / CBS 8797 / KCTC 17520 / NBRC 10181 / NCYC 3082 / Yp74L-3) TaxID=1071383 RepID=J7R6X3_HUIN7|nr:hypothetical protein KNAG_0E03480 [Kazachstania naganishii CBS 8797]CCK70605.1 hypothetical protein KNAG_0E03480 [Kazachstania naganishii CBS 8797]
MIIIDKKKYACQFCIRGHRAASCNHSDRPLTEVRKKGRPSTACSHCKEMREAKNINPSGACLCHEASKSGTDLSPDSEAAMNACLCVTGEPCKCIFKRKRKPKTERKSASKMGVLSRPGDDNILKIDDSFKELVSLLGPGVTTVTAPDTLNQQQLLFQGLNSTSPDIGSVGSVEPQKGAETPHQGGPLNHHLLADDSLTGSIPNFTDTSEDIDRLLAANGLLQETNAGFPSGEIPDVVNSSLLQLDNTDLFSNITEGNNGYEK